MNIYNVLKRPLFSEKNDTLRDKENKYVFEIDASASKKDVEQAVSKLFEVKVTKVCTSTTMGKTQIRRLKGGRVTEGKLPNVKKAVVTLGEGQKINIFENR